MFFTKAVATLALAVSALAVSIPRADSATNVTCGSYTESSTTTTTTAVADDSESWLTGTQTGEGEHTNVKC